MLPVGAAMHAALAPTKKVDLLHFSPRELALSAALFALMVKLLCILVSTDLCLYVSMKFVIVC